jgi:hypothetical protein
VSRPHDAAHEKRPIAISANHHSGRVRRDDAQDLATALGPVEPQPNGREQCAVGAATHRRRHPCRSRDGRTAQTLQTKVLELLKAAQAELIEL